MGEVLPRDFLKYNLNFWSYTSGPIGSSQGRVKEETKSQKQHLGSGHKEGKNEITLRCHWGHKVNQGPSDVETSRKKSFNM